MQWALHGAFKHASTAAYGLIAGSWHQPLGRACTRLRASEYCTRSSASDDRADDAGSKAQPEADSGKAQLPPPPPQWHKRGTWIDPQVIERRMLDDQEESTVEKEPAVEKEPETDVGKSISAIIRYRGGPISVAEYMREVMSNPLGGFYAAHGGSSIGRRGHFITSPEISVLFAEVMAAWMLQHYQDILQSPPRVAYIELGPGRGTLAQQMMAALAMMPGGDALLRAMHVHFVEVSHELRTQQATALQCSDVLHMSDVNGDASEADSAAQQPQRAKRLPLGTPPLPHTASSDEPAPEASNFSEQLLALGSAAAAARGSLSQALGASDSVARGRSALTGGPVAWHHHLNEVPSDMPCIILGHEFLDALPVHVFRLDDDRGWLEVLVDESSEADDPKRLRFVLAPGRTKAAQHILMRRLRALGDRDPRRRALEVNAEAMAVAEAAALRIERCGGLALFVDYGKDGPYESSLNAIRHHEAVHPLQEPGTADLTAWVDFASLRQAVTESLTRVKAHGPITQGQFCLANGMEQRLDGLLQKAERTDEEVAALEDGFARLAAGTEHHPQGMGKTYKVMALTPASMPTPYPFNLDFEALERATK